MLREEQKFGTLLCKPSLKRIVSLKQTDRLLNRVVRENAQQGVDSDGVR